MQFFGGIPIPAVQSSSVRIPNMNQQLGTIQQKQPGSTELAQDSGRDQDLLECQEKLSAVPLSTKQRSVKMQN